jgi:chromosome segregation ATPase
MTRASKTLTVVLVAAFGLWGCSQGPGNHPSAQAERIRSLEARCAKLEEDYRAVATARDQVRKRLAAVEEERGQLEEQRDQLQKELDLQKAVVKERDELRQQVATRTSERDALQVRCERIKKGLQSLLGQDDALAPAPATPVGAVTIDAPAPGQS